MVTIKEKAREYAWKSIISLSNKHIQEDSFGLINIERANMQVHMSSNVTLILDVGSEKKYFQECMPQKNIEKYLRDAVDFYFEYLCEDHRRNEWRYLVLLDIKSKKNFELLKRSGVVYNNSVRAFRSKTYSDFASVGLPSLQDAGFQDDLSRFIKYIRGVIGAYNSNSNLKFGELQSYNVQRKLATRKLAELLNIEKIVPDLKLVKLKLDEKELVGSLMDNGGDVSPCSLSVDARQRYTASFVCDITNMEYFDALCYQLDHRMGNYNICYDNDGETIVGVSAFDNDAPKTFFIEPMLPKQTYCGCSSVLMGGVINRPYMDNRFAVALLSINKEILKKTMTPYLTIIQIWALWQRIKTLQQAVKRTVLKDKNFLVTDWTQFNEKEFADKTVGVSYLEYYKTVDEALASELKLGKEIK